MVVLSASAAFAGEPVVRVVGAKGVPAFWDDAMRRASVVSQDGGNPVIGPDGCLLTYGDTFLGTVDAQGKPKFSGAITNTAMFVRLTPQGPQAEYLTDEKGTARHLIPLEPPENWKQHRIWPGAGVYANHRYYVFYELIAISDKGLGFETTGRFGIMRSKDSWQQWERVRLPKPLPLTGIPHSIVRDPNGYLYLYFLKLTGEPKDVSEEQIGKLLADQKQREQVRSCVHAVRVREEDIENPDRYEPVEGVVADQVFGQVSVVWNAYLDSYVMCQVGPPFDHPREIYLRLSRRPEGPFGAMTKVFALPPKPLTGNLKGLAYCAFLQPLLFKDQGRTMSLTFCEIQGVGEGTPTLVEFQVER